MAPHSPKIQRRDGRCRGNLPRADAWGYCLLLLAGLAKGDQAPEGQLKRLSLEQLGNIEVTTASKAPVKVLRTPAAIYVITQEDIRRSGATSIPEALRLAPGVTVARIDSSK